MRIVSTLAMLAIVALCVVEVKDVAATALDGTSANFPVESEPILKCMSASAMRKALKERNGEVPVMTGGLGKNQILAFFYSQENDTWTMVRASPKEACIIETGQRLRFYNP